MAQPIRKRKTVKVTVDSIKGTGRGLDFCNECPFLGYNENGYICNPNDYIFGKVNGKIDVPKWCGNHK